MSNNCLIKELQHDWHLATPHHDPLTWNKNQQVIQGTGFHFFSKTCCSSVLTEAADPPHPQDYPQKGPRLQTQTNMLDW